MAVMVPRPRESWTDERLDDFRENVNQRFDAVDERLDRLDADVRELRRMMFYGFIAQTTITISCFAGLVVL
jgi:hypothetical protein